MRRLLLALALLWASAAYAGDVTYQPVQVAQFIPMPGMTSKLAASSPTCTGGTFPAGSFACDNFTGTSGTHLDAHTDNAGNAWSLLGSAGAIAMELNGSGSLINSGTPANAGPTYENPGTPASANYTVEATYVMPGATHAECIYIVGRISDSSAHGYWLEMTNDTGGYCNAAGPGYFLYSYTSGGGFSQIGSDATSIGSGSHDIQMIMDSTGVSVKDGATTVIAHVANTDTTGAGHCGIGSNVASGTTLTIDIQTYSCHP